MFLYLLLIWVTCILAVKSLKLGSGFSRIGRKVIVSSNWVWQTIETQKIRIYINFPSRKDSIGSNRLFSLVVLKISMLHFLVQEWKSVRKWNKTPLIKDKSTVRWLRTWFIIYNLTVCIDWMWTSISKNSMSNN